MGGHWRSVVRVKTRGPGSNSTVDGCIIRLHFEIVVETLYLWVFAGESNYSRVSEVVQDWYHG